MYIYIYIYIYREREREREKDKGKDREKEHKYRKIHVFNIIADCNHEVSVSFTYIFKIYDIITSI